MKIAYFSPLNPQRSGISDYSEDLLPYLAQYCNIDIFIDDYIPSNEKIKQKFNIYHYSEFPKLYKNYDVNLYQMGNNYAFHEYIYKFLLQYPGIVTLHDYVLHHFIASSTIHKGNINAYLREFEYCYGKKGLKLGINLIAKKLLPASLHLEYFKYPLSKRIIDKSEAIIVHSKNIKNQIQEISPNINVYKINMGISFQERIDTKEFRKKLNIPDDTFIISSFGQMNSAKRIDIVLQSFAQFIKEYSNSFYFLVGSIDPTLDLQSLIKKLNLENNVKITNFVDNSSFHNYLAITDVCLNLRYPASGETSHSLLKSMSYGKPTFISNTEQFAEFSEDICIKINIGKNEQEEILKNLKELKEDKLKRENLGTKAKNYILNNHNLENVAKNYYEILEKVNIKKTLKVSIQPKYPLVYIIILNWNGKNILQDCLSSVKKLKYPNYKILVVDNNSTDNSIQFLKNTEIELIINKKNYGFTKGNNIGIQYALKKGADYICLLNNDTEVDSLWLTNLVNEAEQDETIGALSSKILFSWNKNLINSTGHMMNLRGNTWDIGIGRIDTPRFNIKKEVISICGAAYFVKAKVLKEIGLFDSKYFAYYEDVDLSLRILKAGYRLVYIPSAIVYHKFSTKAIHDSPFKIYLSKRNRIWMILKLFPFKELYQIFKISTLLPRKKHFKNIFFKIKKNIVCLPSKLILYFKKRGQILAKSLFETRTILIKKQHNLLLFIKILVGSLIIFIEIVYYRLKIKMKSKGYSFWYLIEPTYDEPFIKITGIDYEIINENTLNKSFLSNRIIMGINDNYLGMGWYSLEKDNAVFYREVVKEASCFFNISNISNIQKAILQIHLKCKYAYFGLPVLDIFVDNKKIVEYEIKTIDWHTLQFPITLNKDIVKITLKLDKIYEKEITGELFDLGVMINEISLLPVDSLLLRKLILPSFLDSEKMLKSTSLSPSILKASLQIQEMPTKISKNSYFFVSLKIKNIGDTVWLHNPILRKGFVTLGISLLNSQGEIINLDYDRKHIPSPILPSNEIILSFDIRTPNISGKYKFKFDMVDEQITWFEQQGSIPCIKEIEVI